MLRLEAVRRQLAPSPSADGQAPAPAPAPAPVHAEPAAEAPAEPEPLFRPFEFDRDAWERDQYLVLPGVLTDGARERWLGSLQRLQAMQDSIIRRTPWNDAAAWAPLGLTPRDPPFTLADRERVCGGSEQGGGSGFPEGFGSLPLELRLQAPVVCDGFEWQGFLPESMPAAYDDFIMEVTCHHPQWLELQRVRW